MQIQAFAIAGFLFILFVFVVYLDAKRKEMDRILDQMLIRMQEKSNEIHALQLAVRAVTDTIKDISSRQDTMQEEHAKTSEHTRKTAERLNEVAGIVRENSKQEQLMFEGMSSILNYNLDVARKAVGDRAEE